MGELFVVDWSFILILVALAVLTTALAVRHVVLRRQRQREERRAARRAYRRWLATSNMQPLEHMDPPVSRDTTG